MPKILIIEDDDFTRNSVVKLLEREGFEAIAAADGRAGLELAIRNQPDLILCDLMMPEVDGFKVLAQLQADPIAATIPFICLTAKEERAAHRRIVELGGSDYLTTPFSRDELLGTIAAQIGKKQRIERQQTLAVHEAIAKLNDLVYYDSLTNLPNRLLLRDRFERILPATESNCVGIGVLGLDRLDDFNRGLGTDYSDLIVEAVSQRVLPCLGEGGSIARLNSEQLALIFAPSPQLNIDSPAETLPDRACAVLAALSRPLTVLDYELSVAASLGVAVYPSNGRDFDNLLECASATMHQARKRGGNCYQFYSADIQEKSYDRLMLEMNLWRAIERQELRAYYQPQIDLQTDRVAGAEALVRWEHPDRGFLSPGLFVPLAEETGAIVPLGEWMLKAACQQAKLWHARGHRLVVSVNLSAVQFERSDLIDRIARILSETQIDPSYLELELTESAVVRNPETAIAVLTQLKSLGLKLALDDFGTGYSSLSYLPQFPIDTLKIDRSFINQLHRNAKNSAIVVAIIELAHQLGAKAIAEGIETETQKEFLRQQGCDLVQGYYFKPPISAQQFDTLIDSV